MPQTTLRFNSSASIEGDPRHETRNGEPGVVVPVALAREMVLSYADTDTAYDNEFLPASELDAAAARFNGVPITVGHPRPGQSPAEVGVFDGAHTHETGDGTKLVGEAWLPASGRDAHGSAYREAYDTLADGGTVPVSPGYDLSRVDATPGRHNGTEYDAIQRGLTADHVAIIPAGAGRARCSLADGCALGRANAMTDDMPQSATGDHVQFSTADGPTRGIVRATYDTDEEIPASAFRGNGSLTGPGAVVALTDDAETPLAGEYDGEQRVALRANAYEPVPPDRDNASDTQIHSPTFSGTTTGDWSKPAQNDFSTDDLGDIGEHFLVSTSGFPPDNYGDLKFPVVSSSGTLNLSALQNARSRVSQADGLSSDDKDRLDSKIVSLANDNFDDADFSTDRDNAAGRIAGALETIGAALGVGVDTTTDARVNSQPSDESAESDSGADPSQQTPMTDMDDDDLIDDLVDAGFTRANMEMLRGTQCLTQVHDQNRLAERVNAAADEAGGADGETPDLADADITVDPDGGNDGSGDGDGGGSGGGAADNEDGDGTPPENDSMNLETRADFEAAVAEVLEHQRENADREQLIGTIDERSDRWNAEMLEGAPSAVLHELAADVAADNRANAQAGGGGHSQPFAGDGPMSPGADMRGMQTNPLAPRSRANAAGGDDAPDVPVGDDPFGKQDGAESEADD